MSTTNRMPKNSRTVRFIVACALVAFALLLVSPTWADEWVMPGLDTQWIARDMELNGVPTSMRSVLGEQGLDEVLGFYRREWRDALDERIDGDWHVLATRQRGQFVSLRIRQAGAGVQGILTASADFAMVEPNLDSALPIPHGLTRLGHQAFRDQGSTGENLTLMSPRSVSHERQAFQSLYQRDGWVLTEDRGTQSVRNGHVLQFVRGKDQARIVFYRDPQLANGRTLILVTAHRD